MSPLELYLVLAPLALLGVVGVGILLLDRSARNIDRLAREEAARAARKPPAE